ncbi:type II secretion system protein A [Vulcaniibacterium tengchongense]|uniref:Type II secretion system protein A n=2 Tax=Vulcaniibacterium tengchongense TaxID=1273429 RepID=A0A3N4VC65_9GAMM|nr:AAA family ATPase [Vulcaniibacterium tengchongense]RPE77219.1 type II secretion system protein A [Vulcaniibacterium tengchongense]
MYLEHYGLAEPPFSITPDPRFVFLSERHRDALAHLLFGIGQGGGGGFVQLTGEVGTGKTTLCRLLLEQLPADTRAALVLNPRLTPVELLETICEELRLDLAGRRGSPKALVDALNAYLLDAYAQGLRVVLIVDEAQALSPDALEQIRLLTNLETPTQKLLQILLLGQPELRALLAREDMRQLAQRITARYHLTPLDADETERYLRHRFRVAGGHYFPFTAAAARRIHAHSGGVPRLINIVAERSLLAGYAHDLAQLDARWVDRAAREALPRPPAARRWPGAAALAAALAAAAVAAWWWRAPPPGPASAEAQPRLAAGPRPVAAARDAAPAPTLDAAALRERIAAGDGSPLPAWRRLLALWEVPAAAAAQAAGCPADFGGDLHCLRGQARLDALVALGRPALLRLHADGHERWAVLEGADAARVLLRLDEGRDVWVERLALEQVWSGAYVALWRAPLSAAPAVATGPALDWARARLRSRDPQAGAGDAALAQAVRRFQRGRGLSSDGLIGPETLMALAADAPGPRLRGAE